MQGYLVLDTGEVYEGRWHGGEARAGEVVFNTSHSGYEEIATDPSYHSQIVLMTAPMMGNYGTDREVWESRRIWIQGFLALQIQENGRDAQWVELLKQNGVPLMDEFDTRALTLRLRSGGTPWGALLTAGSAAEAKEKAPALIKKAQTQDKDWVYTTSRKETETYKGMNPAGPRVAVLDFGAKENILRELRTRCSELTVFSSRATPEQIKAVNPQALMLTNGPGDPADVQVAPDTIKHFLGQLPIFGICMGHQVLGLALGAKTYKLKFGHRGSNHPIKDTILDKVYMTSQNHGYAVEARTLPADVRVTQVNLNDQTVAGFYSREKQCLGIQYHPESSPGPNDATPLFDFFINEMVGLDQKRGRP